MESPRQPSRRRFIRLLGGAAGAGLVPLNFGCGDTRVVGSRFVPTPDDYLTPNDQFYINYNNGMPRIPVEREWRLHVRGLVDREESLGLDELQAFEHVTAEVTLECVGNSPGGNLISSAAFTGARLRDVMESAGLRDRARGLQFLGLDGYPSYLSSEAAREDEPLLVWGMNGEPLPDVHGAPVRVLFPGRYGMFSIKWLDSITATRTYHTYGAFAELSSFIDGRTDVRSKVFVDDVRTVRLGEEVMLTGLALTPGVGVDAVQVRVNDEWRDAELSFNTVRAPTGPHLWTLWRLPWVPGRVGRHTLAVRAFDRTGRGQTKERGFPYDSSAIHSVGVLVRE